MHILETAPNHRSANHLSLLVFTKKRMISVISKVRKNIDKGIIHDPTYSRTKEKSCPKCGYNEALFFHDFTQEGSGMKLIFVCCNENCAESWENKNEDENKEENENKEEIFITEHEKSQLEIVSTDWKPMAEVIFAKVKGIQKENQLVNLEEFIAVKGIKALGNQLTTDKVKQINLLEPLPFEEPIEEEEAPTENLESETPSFEDIDIQLDDDGQITLSLE